MEEQITRLSVNVNKIATLRNARGGNVPDVESLTGFIAFECGADGITVHPRPDERHITYADVRAISKLLCLNASQHPDIEFNIEGNPIPKFVDLVCEVHPTQVTLVPDAPDALTSNAGWDTVTNADFLCKIVKRFHAEGIRVSIFVEPDSRMVIGAKEVEADRVELYTEAYARLYPDNEETAIEPYRIAALTANTNALGLNAGHDLNAENLAYFLSNVPGIQEVSIGQALIADALYYGLKETIKRYKYEIHKASNIYDD